MSTAYTYRDPARQKPTNRVPASVHAEAQELIAQARQQALRIREEAVAEATREAALIIESAKQQAHLILNPHLALDEETRKQLGRQRLEEATKEIYDHHNLLKGKSHAR